MKTLLVSLFVLATSVSLTPQTFAHDDEISQTRVNCQILGTRTWVQVLKNSGMPAEVSLYQAQGNESKELVRVVGRDVKELLVVGARLNVVATHHNTEIKISSDYDFFGGDLSVAGEEYWNGLIYLSANVNPVQKDTPFIGQVNCSHEI